MNIEDIKIGDTLYYNSYGMRGVRVSKICKVIDIQDNQPIILVRGSNSSYPSYPAKLSADPMYRVVNISRDALQEYINTDISKDVKTNDNYYKSVEDRLNKHYNRARISDARRGW